MIKAVALTLFCVWAGYIIGGYAIEMRHQEACRQYFQVLPDKEKPLVCREVLGK